MIVVAEERDWLYLRKPAGLHTFGREAPGLAEQLADERPEQLAVSWPAGFAAGVLHRLAGWTSGLVVAARSLEALEAGRAAFTSHTLHKRYRLLSDRDVPWDEHVVEHALAHDKRRRRKMVWQRGPNTPHRGRWYPAHTELRRLGKRGPHHLWEATIRTGVMHQVRLHAASVGLPVLGDRLYGGGGDGRFFLHHRTIDGWPGDVPSLALPDDWPGGAA